MLNLFAVDPKRNYEVTAKNTREKTCVGETLEKKNVEWC